MKALLFALSLTVIFALTSAIASQGGDPTLFVRLRSDYKGRLQGFLTQLGYDVADDVEEADADDIYLFMSENELSTLSDAVEYFYNGLDSSSADSERRIRPTPKVLFNRREKRFSRRNVDAEAYGILKKYFFNPMGIPSGYHSLKEINDFLTATENSFPSIAKVIEITQYGKGKTHEGRLIYAIKIATNVDKETDKPNILINALHHAREITTSELAMHIIAQLTNGYGKDTTITKLVENNNIYVIPVVNPDGHEYVFTKNNWWRKNRRNNGNNIFGVDLNRNYDLGWQKCVGDNPPSSDIYKGPSPFSEPETSAIKGFTEQKNFAKVLDFHSFGREVLHTYRCTSQPKALKDYIINNAKYLSKFASYGVRYPSDDGEHQEWQIKTTTNFAFLVEIGDNFQPSYSACQSEIKRVFPLVLGYLNTTIPVAGHIVDEESGKPLKAKIDTPGIIYTAGETKYSHEETGAYYVFLPAGKHNITFSAPGYITESHVIEFPDITRPGAQTVVKDIKMATVGPKRILSRL